MMLMYDVYYKDYKNSQANKIAILFERRSEPNRQNGLKWARKMFGNMFRDTHCIFIIPREGDMTVG